MSSTFDQVSSLTTELATLERLKKSMYNVVNTLAPSFLIGSSSFLQVTRTIIKPRRSSTFGKIRPETAALAALERLEKYHILRMRNSSAYIFDWIIIIWKAQGVRQ